MSYVVLLEKLEQNSESLEDKFSRSFASLSLPDDFEKAKAIFIKPNLTYPCYKEGVSTRKEFVESLVAALRRIDGRTKIYIGEGEGGYNSFSMSDAMQSMGYYDIASKFPLVEVINLSKVPRSQVELVVRGREYPLDLPAIFFHEIDFSISCPVPKVHCMTGVSLAFKNQWGCLPDVMRLKNHYVFNEIIGQLCDKLKFRYAFLDGKYGLNSNGPMVGDPVEVNWFVASNSLGAFDIIVSEMMGFDWRKVNHLRTAAHYGYLPKREDIEILGDMEALKQKFNLERNFWDYLALAAFHSKHLTHLFYFSKWAKLLHDIMYTFRKRPVT